MGGAASKAKGSAFERDICIKLSLWVTDNKRKDVFWRSAMSGGRATVASKRGMDVRQAGDITAVAPEGHALIDKVFIECKFYANLSITSFVISNKGQLAKFWGIACADARRRGKLPWLIAKQNRQATLLITDGGHRSFLNADAWIGRLKNAVIWNFDKVLLHRAPYEFRPKNIERVRLTPKSKTAPTAGAV